MIPPAPSTATTLRYKSFVGLAPPIFVPAHTIVSAVVYPVPGVPADIKLYVVPTTSILNSNPEPVPPVNARFEPPKL